MKAWAWILPLFLIACGGGEATDQEKAEADQAVQEAKIVPHPPVNCAARPEACK